MKKILHIVGARPQFIKVNVVIKFIEKKNKKIKNFLFHTGQHYDDNMSKIFFNELKIKKPHFNLNLKKEKNRLKNIAKMILAISNVIDKLKPQMILAYGDTDSTMAAAITARKKNIKLIHIEAGMRSFDIKMPEEQNRLITDKLSDYYITVSKDSTNNLKKEGVKKNQIFEYGDVMYDSLLYYKKKNIFKDKNSKKKPYAFFTIHRDSNSNYKTLHKIIKNLGRLKTNILWPVHPKIEEFFKKKFFKIPNNLILTKPKSYLNTLRLVSNCSFVITDSGGLLREAFYLNKKTFIIRNETEWPELLKNNSAKLIGDNINIIKQSKLFLKKKITNKNVLGNGRTSVKLAKLLEKLLKLHE